MNERFKKIITYIKKHKDFIIWVYKKWKGPLNLRAFKIWLAFLVTLAGGNCIYFALNSDAVWSFELSYNSIGMWDAVIAFISFLGFYSLLYFDNKKSFNEGLEKVVKTQMQLLLDPIKLYKDFRDMDFSHGLDFIPSSKTEEIVKKLRDESNRNIRILGVSGMGKTYAIQQAFLGLEDEAPVFYCDNTEDSRFMTALETLNSQYPDGGTLILDNCRYDVYSMVKSRYGRKFRIISAFYDITVGSNDDRNIFIVEDDVKALVNQIVEEKIRRDASEENRAKLKDYSGNNTYMALLLVNTYNESKEIGKIDDDTLFSKLLYVEGDNQQEYRIAERTLALCQPIGYEAPDDKELEYLKSNKSITRFETNVDRDAVFERVIETLEERNLLEHDATFINMRPQPLAIWLVGEWLTDCKEKRFYAILKDLSVADKQLADRIIDAWCARLRLLKGDKRAESVCEKLYDVKNGLFSSEDVVCSDHGSRLFLAMCTVNPVISANSLSSVIGQMSFERIEKELTGDARRNVVRALEKLSFSHSSYDKAIPALAKLAVAENETWANNAKGQFLQLFHVQLAGTEASLIERLEVLKSLHEIDSAYTPLVVDAIGSALSFGHFVRMGGAEDFGIVSLVDYRPSYKEMVEYWEGIINLAMDILSEDKSYIPVIAKIVAKKARQIANAGCMNVLAGIMGSIMPLIGDEWPEMRETLITAKNYDSFSQDDSKLLDEMLKKLEPQAFMNRYNDVMYSILSQHALKGADIMKMQEEAAKPFAEEFLSERLYKQEGLNEVLIESDGHELWQLARWVAVLANETQFAELLSAVLDIVKEKDKNFSSRFIDQLLFTSENKLLNDQFVDDLYNHGYFDMFARLSATMDRDGLEYFNKLHGMLRDGKLEEYYFIRFLESKRTMNLDTIYSIASVLFKTECLSDRMVTTFNFLSTCWFMDSLYQREDIMTLLKEVTLQYPLEKISNSHDFPMIVEHILVNADDNDFAKLLNRKFIEYLDKSVVHNGLPRIYNILLTKYRDAIWDDFSTAIIDFDNYGGFYLNVRYEIGSGFEFGEKCLFAGHYDQIKELCKNNPKNAPFIMASMCPIFKDDNDEATFHPFVIWLIDEFGTDDNVLSEIHANMGTFHWTGSTIPLINKRRRCFEGLLNHKYPNVRDWAARCLKAESADRQIELRNEAYNKLRFQK